MPDSIEVDWNHCVIVSAEHVFNHNAKECPNVELFHAYVGGSGELHLGAKLSTKTPGPIDSSFQIMILA